MSKRIGTMVIVTLVLFFAWEGYDYLHYRHANAVSDAAFIKSDRLATLSFKVGGKVVTLSKKENEPVEKGELLAVIDPKDFNVTRQKIAHLIEATTEAIEAMRLKKARLKKTLAIQKRIAETDIDALGRQIGALSFRIDAAKKRLEKLRKDMLRYKNMLENRLIASGDFETVAMHHDALKDEIEGMKKERQAMLAQKRKAVDARRIAGLNEKQILELTKSIKARTKELQAQKKSLETVENSLAYSRLYAPFDAIVAKKFIEAPRVVKKGTPVYAVTDPKALYCEVLLSEKKMHGVRPGNSVKINVDAIEDKAYRGTVESIAPTSASTFSLVPRDIASGEFTKLDQRFVIRIKLDDIEGLRAGMGATVAIARNAGE